VYLATTTVVLIVCCEKKFFSRLCQQRRNAIGYASPKQNKLYSIKTVRIYKKNITRNILPSKGRTVTSAHTQQVHVADALWSAHIL